MPLVTETDSASQEFLELVDNTALFKEVTAELLQITVRGIVQPDSRYRSHRIVKMISPSGSTRTIETWEKPYLKKGISSTDRYYTITAGTAFRPDLIAQDTLNNRYYWWWIMYSNDIFDITQLTPGKTLVIKDVPTTPLSDLEFGAV